MTHETETRPQAAAADDQPIVDLQAAAAELLGTARASKAGRAARTLTPGAGAALKQALLALVDGQRLADHDSPTAATLQVLVGAVRLTGGGEDIDLRAGEHAPIPPVRHGLQALGDAVVLLSVAQGARP